MELFKIFGTLALLGVGDVNRQLDDVTGKGKNSESILTQAFHKVGRAVASAFTAEKIIQFGKDVVETAGRSQASFAKVTTLLDTSKINVDKYYQSVKKGANESGISIADFSEALYQSLSASVDAGDAVNFTTKAVKLAKAGFTDASTAVDVMTTAINAYGLSAKDADHISDDLITTQNLGKTTVDQLAQSMGRVIPTASAYGVNIDNLCSSYAIMTKSGIQTSEATTYLKGMLDELGDSGSQVSSILQSKTGKSFAECMKSGMSLGDVLQVLYDACGDNSTAFANLWSSQEAGTGALSLVNAGAKEFNGTLDKMQHNAGATSSAYEKVENTFEAKLERLKNKFNNFKSDLGEGALPVIGKLVDGLSSLLGWVDKHIKQIKALALAIGGAVATFAALKAALAIAAAIKTFVTAISMATSATALLKGAMIALSATFPISTMGLVIIAIAALVGAFIYLWNTSDSFRNFWINLWNGIKTVVITVVNAVKNFLTGAWDGITSATEQMWNGVKDFFTGLWNGIKNVFTTVVGGIGSFLSGAWSGITSGISTAWSAITNVFTTVWDTIKNVIQVALEFIRNLIVGWFQIVTIPWRFIWENFGDDIITAWDGIKNVISNALDAIRTVISTVWNAIKTIIEPIVNGIRAVIEIEWNGIKIVTTTVFNAVKTVITTIWNGISAFISSVLNIIKSVFSSVWNSIQTAVTNVVNAIRTVITNTMNGHAKAVKSFLPESFPNFHEASTVYTYDPDKAKSLLAEAGVQNLSVTLLCNNNWVSDLSAQIQNDLNAVGINTTLDVEAINWSSLAPSDDVLPYDVMLTPGDPSCFGADPDLLMTWWYGDNVWTRGRSCWAETDEWTKLQDLLQQAREATGDDQQKIWNDCFDLISEQVPIYPLFHRELATGWQESMIDGFQPISTTGLVLLGCSAK